MSQIRTGERREERGERREEKIIANIRSLLQDCVKQPRNFEFQGFNVSIENNSFSVWNESYGLKISYADQSLSIEERAKLGEGVVSKTTLQIDNKNLITFETHAAKPGSTVTTPRLTPDQQNNIIDKLLERALDKLQEFKQQTQLNTKTLPKS